MSSASSSAPGVQPVVMSCAAMGTTFELVLVGERRDVARLGSIGEAVFAGIREVESRWSLFLPGSRLAQLNRTGHERGLDLDADDVLLFRVADETRRRSGGAFDPNVARPMQSAGHFDARGLRAYLGDVGQEHLDVLGGGRDDRDPCGPPTWLFDECSCQVSFTGRGPAIDLGAVAKGHALDLAARDLREFGVGSALLHGGTSSVLAIGSPPGHDAWTVRVDGRDVALKEQALGVSHAGSQSAGKGTHILIPGPRGESVAPDRRAAVLANSAAQADAWATAICVDPSLKTKATDYFQQQGIEILPGTSSGITQPLPSAT